MKDIKLVIWDLDETFWHGTLSEGEVSQKPEYIKFVKEITDRGIMNSIVSKNDYDKAAKVLTEWGIFDYFIFPQISWNPKGEVVKKLLETCKLREENTLFIDDNISNIEEVKFYNPKIETSLPINVAEILDSPAFKGKDDKQHSRLKQYKVLEQRFEAKASFSSNEEFLRSSNIRIVFCDDCIAEEKRIFELVQRTNQLNYTKIRCSEQELHDLLVDKNTETKYVKVWDNFGDYGIVGFYALKDKRLIHFLFSCRTLGFGIENYIWAKLGYPEVNVQGEVATDLSTSVKIDWINEEDAENKGRGASVADVNSSEIRGRMLIVSGCDMEGAVNFIEGSYAIDKEFATVADGNNIKTSDTSQLVNTLTLTEERKQELCNHLPHFRYEVTFGTKIFSGQYDVVVLSVVDDYIRGIYKSKTDDVYIGCADWYGQEEQRAKYPAHTWNWLDEHFFYIGKEPLDVFRSNLKTIIEHISNTTKIILVNGIDLDVSDWIGKERVMRNLEMNAIVDEIVAQYSNVELLDMRKIVISRSMLTKQDNRHFNRAVYYQMAKELISMCKDKTMEIKVHHPSYYKIKRVINKILSTKFI